MFKVIAMTANEVGERSATLSHRDDAILIANTWSNFHDLVRIFSTEDMNVVSEYRRVGTKA